MSLPRLLLPIHPLQSAFDPVPRANLITDHRILVDPRSRSFRARTASAALPFVAVQFTPKAHFLLAKGHRCFGGLTFELSGRQRQDARARTGKMYRVPQAGPWWPAVGAPLERGVRPPCAVWTGRGGLHTGDSDCDAALQQEQSRYPGAGGDLRESCMALCALRVDQQHLDLTVLRSFR
jgi:hypothetical protein